MPTDTRPAPGAVSAKGGPVRKAPLAWIPIVGLLLLLALIALAVVLALNIGDDGDRAGVDLTNDPASVSTATRAAPATGGPATGGPASAAGSSSPAASTGGTGVPTTVAAAAGAGSSPAGAGPTLQAGSTPILPAPSGGLSSLAGQAVTGAATVQSVVADEGFWVGPSATERVFVHLTPQARSTNGESPFQVVAGQTVRLTGRLTAVPADVSSLGVDADEGAAQLRSEGQYVEAASITLS